MILKVWLIIEVLFALTCLLNGEKSLPIPEQVHIALAEDIDAMTVQWVTIESTPNTSFVKYGKDPNALDRFKVANTTIFEYDGMIRFMHSAVMTKLEPATTYCKLIQITEVGSKEALSRVFNFRTLPFGIDVSYRVCVFGDLGVDNGVSLVYLQREAERHQFDLIIHVGDIAYDLHTNNGSVGDTFMRNMEPIISSIPYMVIAGNHEDDGKNFSHYKYRFQMPNCPFNDNQVYSFDLGPVHFVGVSTEYHGFFNKYGQQQVFNQHKWLEEDLKNAHANRAQRPFIVVYQHRPFYCSNTNSFECGSFENTLIRTGFEEMPGLEQLFMQYGVDLGFFGHEHSYERFYPISDRTVYNLTADPYNNAAAPTYVITGSAGCHSPHASFNEQSPVPGSAMRSTDYGYSIMHVLNRTSLFIEQISVEAGVQQIDSFWLRKDLGHAPTSKFSRSKRGVPFPPIVEPQTCNIRDPRCQVKRSRRMNAFKQTAN
ncbi:Purple acid phosphatase [Aphelenchoides bicaudatus]|nr:Purple acid phosphatase [Aphelenchoides bicaudatus]